MKKSLLTAVLTAYVVFSLLGCGAKETTFSESVADSTVVETTVAVEEVVVLPTVAEIKAAYDAQNYISATHLEKYNETGEETYTEYLIDRVSNIICITENMGITYADINSKTAYYCEENESEFHKVDLADGMDELLDDSVDWLFNKMFTILGMEGYKISINDSGDIEAKLISLFEDGSGYIRYVIVADSNTYLPKTATARMIKAEEGTTINEEEMTAIERIATFSYPIEGTEDFETFKAAITLLSDEK